MEEVSLKTEENADFGSGNLAPNDFEWVDRCERVSDEIRRERRG